MSGGNYTPGPSWLAIGRITEAGRRLSANAGLTNRLAIFVDYWGLDCYTPPAETMAAVRDIIRALLILSQEDPVAPAPAGIDAETIAAIIEPSAWDDDYDPYECTDDGRSGAEVRSSSLCRARAILAIFGYSALSSYRKQGG
jgi:hypothetical protein